MNPFSGYNKSSVSYIEMMNSLVVKFKSSKQDQRIKVMILPRF